MENGKREPRLSLLTALAVRLGVPARRPARRRRRPPGGPPSRSNSTERSGSAAYADARTARGAPEQGHSSDEALEAIVGLHRELARRASEAIATPEEARRANTDLREWMRDRDNHLPEIETLAEDQLRAVGHVTGALTHRSVSRMASDLGFELVHVDDLPHSARSVTDLANGRIYLPPASIPGGHGLRSMALQAMAHRVLGHDAPTSYAEFLRQRLEINYFAAACLMPRAPVGRLPQRGEERAATSPSRTSGTRSASPTRRPRCDSPTSRRRTSTSGCTSCGSPTTARSARATRTTGSGCRVDVTGSIEGQPVCRQWSARTAFTRTNRTTEYYQYTDTPEGTFFESTQTGTSASDEFSITVGVPFADAKWFRGRETARRERRAARTRAAAAVPPSDLAAQWAGQSWSSAKVHAHIVLAAAVRSVPGRRRPRAVRVPRGARRPVARSHRGVPRRGDTRAELA